MRNPYEDEKDLTDYRVGRGAAAVFSAIFLLLLALPPLLDLLSKSAAGKLADSPVVKLISWRPGAGQELRGHLVSVEAELDRLA